MSKHQPEKTTGSLVSLIGHITVRELRQELSEIEAGNGFANRWLWVFARRSKQLPRGGQVDDAALEALANRINKALTDARGRGMLDMTEEAWEAWELLYEQLSEADDDLLGAVTARAEAHVRRLAVLYALLGRKDVVEIEHLRAAIAVWDYCAASAARTFA
jgi:DNA replicative helicase MCM subunit Mcm2 (Cdc46/Mcm family)